MIFIRGDTHGNLNCFLHPAVIDYKKWTVNDYFIVAGDFGIVFNSYDADERKLDTLSNLPYHILFIDGNHEGFPHLKCYPETI